MIITDNDFDADGKYKDGNLITLGSENIQFDTTISTMYIDNIVCLNCNNLVFLKSTKLITNNIMSKGSLYSDNKLEIDANDIVIGYVEGDIHFNCESLLSNHSVNVKSIISNQIDVYSIECDTLSSSKFIYVSDSINTKECVCGGKLQTMVINTDYLKCKDICSSLLIINKDSYIKVNRINSDTINAPNTVIVSDFLFSSSITVKKVISKNFNIPIPNNEFDLQKVSA